MLCRALVTAIAISYLICVLWLSGMQKEDLDVNMLRKLQRHNVNIDDMKGESLRDECLKYPVINNETMRNDSKENKTTTEISKIKNKHTVKNIIKNDLSLVIKDLLERHMRTTAFPEQGSSTVRPTVTDGYTDVDKTDALTLSSETTEINIDVTKHENHKSQLENIINFWQMFTTTKRPRNFVEITTKKPSDLVIPINESTTHVVKGTDNDRQVQKYINKLIADYIDKTQKLTTEIPTNMPPVDLNKLSQQIEKLLKMYPQGTKVSEMDISNESKSIRYTPPDKFTFTDIADTPQQHELHSNIIKSKNIKKNKLNEINLKHKNDVLIVPPRISEFFLVGKNIPQKAEIYSDRIQQYKNYKTRSNENNYTEKKHIKNYTLNTNKYFFVDEDLPRKSEIYSKRLKQYTNLNINENNITNAKNVPIDYFIPFLPTYVTRTPIILVDNEKERINKTVKPVKDNVSKADNINILSTDFIKEIAANIKALVLKDLRQEVTLAPKSTTSLVGIISANANAVKTNTNNVVVDIPATSSQTPTPNKTQDATQVMEKFIKLFEQLKTIKEKAVVTKMEMKISGQSIKSPLYNPSFINNREPNLFSQPKANMIPNYQPFIFSPFGIQSIPLNPGDLPISNKNIGQYSPPIPKKDLSKKEPLTIQTNSGEIPPLGIPISKPLQLIHQNIVVTTERPIITPEKQRNKWRGAYKQESNFRDVTRSSREKLDNYNSHKPNPSAQTKTNTPLNAKYNKKKTEPLDTILYRSAEIRNLDRSRPARLRDEKIISSKQRFSKSEKNSFIEDDNRSLRSEGIKSLEKNSHTGFQNQEAGHRLQPLEIQKSKILQRPYKYTKPKIRENMYHLPNGKAKSVVQNPYKNARITNLENIHHSLSFVDGNRKTSSPTFYISDTIRNQQNSHGEPKSIETRIVNHEDSRFSPRFEYQKAKSEPYQRIKSREDGLYTPWLDEENVKLDLSRYKSERDLFQDNRYPQFKNDKVRFLERNFYKSASLPLREDEEVKFLKQKVYKGAIISDQKEYRPPQLEDIINSRLKDKTPYVDDTMTHYGDKISFGTYKNKDRERFHEKLEQVEDWQEEAYNRKDRINLTSRQQQPLNAMKKTSTFDDTHFRNFLKTQKKVNDMLERILATKAHPPSVETT